MFVRPSYFHNGDFYCEMYLYIKATRSKESHNQGCLSTKYVSGIYTGLRSSNDLVWSLKWMPRYKERDGKELMTAGLLVLCMCLQTAMSYYTPRTTKLLGGILVSLRPSVRPSRIPCLLCSAYSSGWIHFIFKHLIKQLWKVYRFLQNLNFWQFKNL